MRQTECQEKPTLVRSEINPASSSATLAIVVSMNLPIAPLSSGTSANKTSTPELISFNRNDTLRERRSSLVTTSLALCFLQLRAPHRVEDASHAMPDSDLYELRDKLPPATVEALLHRLFLCNRGAEHRPPRTYHHG